MFERRITIVDPEWGALHSLDSNGIVRRIGKDYPTSPDVASMMLADEAINDAEFLKTVVAYALEFGYDMSDMIETGKKRNLPAAHIALMGDDERVASAEHAVMATVSRS